MLPALLALLLHAGPAHLVVWGGGTSPEAAQVALASWTQRSAAWSEWLTLAPGFPRVVDSSKLPELHPGFFIVVLGTCDEGEVAERVGLLKVLEPAVYEKAATWPEAGGCPRLGAKDGEPWTVSSPARLRLAQGELTVLTLTRGEEPTWSSQVLARFEPKRGDAVFTHFEHADCEATEPALTKGGLSVEGRCVTGRCTTWGSSLFRYRYTVHEGRIVETPVELKVLARMQCD
jgi:hypothetical protein